MGLGLICLTGCAGYIFYMRKKYENMGYTPVITESGQEVYTRKTSKWER